MANVSGSLLGLIQTALEDAKAEEIVTLDLAGQSALADQMIVATGRSDRHVGAIAERVMAALKDWNHSRIRVEGMNTCEWVLIDAGDVIVHVFKPEARAFYNLERLWGADRPREKRTS
jgi:ribosome-associated protein